MANPRVLRNENSRVLETAELIHFVAQDLKLSENHPLRRGALNPDAPNQQQNHQQQANNQNNQNQNQNLNNNNNRRQNNNNNNNNNYGQFRTGGWDVALLKALEDIMIPWLRTLHGDIVSNTSVRPGAAAGGKTLNEESVQNARMIAQEILMNNMQFAFECVYDLAPDSIEYNSWVTFNQEFSIANIRLHHYLVYIVISCILKAGNVPEVKESTKIKSMLHEIVPHFCGAIVKHEGIWQFGPTGMNVVWNKLFKSPSMPLSHGRIDPTSQAALKQYAARLKENSDYFNNFEKMNFHDQGLHLASKPWDKLSVCERIVTLLFNTDNYIVTRLFWTPDVVTGVPAYSFPTLTCKNKTFQRHEWNDYRQYKNRNALSDVTYGAHFSSVRLPQWMALCEFFETCCNSVVKVNIAATNVANSKANHIEAINRCAALTNLVNKISSTQQRHIRHSTGILQKLENMGNVADQNILVLARAVIDLINEVRVLRRQVDHTTINLGQEMRQNDDAFFLDFAPGDIRPREDWDDTFEQLEGFFPQQGEDEEGEDEDDEDDEQ